MGIDSKVKREKSAKAVALALEGKWEEAAVVNRELLELFPEDVETLNRLGKAYLEMGRYSMARGAFGAALAVAPHNSIAKKNLHRLESLPYDTDDEASPPSGPTRVLPNLFIEDSGKSGVTVLHKPAPASALAKVAPGDSVDLQADEKRLAVYTPQGQLLGEVEPKLANRLLRLIRQGNRYSGAVVSAQHPKIAVALREVYTHPSLLGIASFPSKGSVAYAPQLPDTYARMDRDSDSDSEDDDAASGWGDAYENGGAGEMRVPAGPGFDDDEDEGE